MNFKIGFSICAICLLQLSILAKDISIEGELKLWHNVIITIDGPKTNENAKENPFVSYRLDIIFTSEKGTEYIVPGYFAADGNAANSSAKTGNKWRVIFTPTETGVWKYRVAFRKGENVAIIAYQEKPEAGKKAGNIDGYEGEFTIQESDKTGVDFRSPDKGILLFDGNRYLKYQGSEKYYLKAGQGSPETFIAYKDFDDVRDLKGDFIHAYDVHAEHYDESASDYIWQNGKGKNILGSINYLSQQGVNSQYVILTTLEGDGHDSWPWADPEDFTRFDCSKLDQWNQVFTYMNHKGLLLTALLFEAENEQILDKGEALGIERKLYYREMIARFSHLPGVVWIISEETRLYHEFPPEYNSQRINHLHLLEPYKHSIGLHNGTINGLDYKNTPNFTYFSLHASADNWQQVHSKMLYRINEAKRTGNPWTVFFDECVSAQYGVKTDEADPNHDLPRKEGIWGTLLAGGGGVSWYYGYKSRHNDLYCEDFTLRENMFHQTRLAVDFFQNNEIPFWEMENRNDLVDNGRCLAKENEVYVIQLEGATFASLYFENDHNYEIKWFDPVNGGDLQVGTKRHVSGSGTNFIGRPPGDPEMEWIVLVKRTAENKEQERIVFEENNGVLLIEAEKLPIDDGWSVENNAAGYSGAGYIVWKGENHHQQPGHGLMEVTIKIEQEGKYAFEWLNRVGIGDNPTEANDTWLRFPNAANFYGEKTKASEVSRIYPRGLGKTPEPEGAGADGWFKVYSSLTMDWSWGCYVSDNDIHPVFVEFDEPGEYTLQISGRSQGHAIDVLRLYHSSVNREDLDK